MGNLSAFAACAWVLYKNGDVDAALAGKFGQPVGFMNGCVLAGVALYFLLAALSTLLCGAPRRNATKPATKKD
ncbi:MAG: hypothetical protein EOO65_05760 [Methanosarcinales archaeon]|nr:MAG: hypothetical protein EOO65_05760 [Methanosarcinales archaeon]